MIQLTNLSSEKEKVACTKELINTAKKRLKELAAVNELCKKLNYFLPKDGDLIRQKLEAATQAKEEFLKQAIKNLPFLTTVTSKTKAKDGKSQTLANEVAEQAQEVVNMAEEMGCRFHCLQTGRRQFAKEADRLHIIAGAKILVTKEYNTADFSAIREMAKQHSKQCDKALEALTISCS